jgi:hypothetical protein
MALLEHEAQRFADTLDGYKHVSVADIGGNEESGFWLVVHDHRFDLRYEIASHCDYWDFIGAIVDHRQYIGHSVRPAAQAATSPAHRRATGPASPAATSTIPGRAIGRPAGAAISAAEGRT